jgi:ABC-type phosphate/phosphonate transport system permease subunit
VYALRVMANFAAEVRSVLAAGTPIHRRLRDRLAALALTTVGFDLVCGALAYLFEHGQADSQIRSFGGAIFWTTTQLLTVSSNLSNPISAPARVLDVLMEIYAITVIGTLAAAFGAFLIRRGDQLDAAGSAAEQERPLPRGD